MRERFPSSGEVQGTSFLLSSCPMQDVNDINGCTCYSGGDKMSAYLETSNGFQREGKKGLEEGKEMGAWG